MAKKKELAPLVRYDNKLNMIAFKGMSQVENDVFFALLYKLRDKGVNEVRLDFSELKRLIGFEQNSEIIRKSVVGIAEKIARSIVKYETDESIKFFTLFQVLEVPKKDDYYIKAKISEPFAFMLNNLKDNYTAFEIAEFSNLTSKYAQTLYRLLKQFRSKGICTIFENDWERFKELMDIPPKMNMCDIDKDILKPAIKELMTERNLFDQTRAPFKGLFYEKHRGNSKGRPIIGISFYFLPQMQDTKFKDQAQKKSNYCRQRHQAPRYAKTAKAQQPYHWQRDRRNAGVFRQIFTHTQRQARLNRYAKNRKNREVGRAAGGIFAKRR